MFSHLLTVKLLAYNCLICHTHALTLLRNQYLDGFVDGTLLYPLNMVHMTSATGAPASVTNLGLR
jgi:hypothetical protein